MSSEISPIREDEACGRPTTPECEGTHKSLAKQKRSPGTVTPIGSPTPERHVLAAGPWQQQDRTHANSWTFADLFSGQERPNSAPLERPLSAVSPSPGSKESSPSSTAPMTPADRAAAAAKTAATAVKVRSDSRGTRPQQVKSKQHLALSPEQPTFHPQPRRHQPWVTPLLESVASPVPLSPETAQDPGVVAASWTRVASAGWDESSAAGAVGGSSIVAASGNSDHRGSSGSAEPFASTPSPDREGTGHAVQQDWMDSPKPCVTHRSVQNTPEPTHYHYGAGMGLGPQGQPISTPSPSAMSALGQSHQQFLGLPPRFPGHHGAGMGGMMMPGLGSYGAGSMASMLPPPLPTPGSATSSSDVMGIGFGGSFRPTAQEALAAASSEQTQMLASSEGASKGVAGQLPGMQPNLPMGFQDGLAAQQLAASYQDGLAAQQLAASYQAFQQQAYQYGVAAAAAAASAAAGWRACPPMPMGCSVQPGGCMESLSAPPPLFENQQLNGQADGQLPLQSFGGQPATSPGTTPGGAVGSGATAPGSSLGSSAALRSPAVPTPPGPTSTEAQMPKPGKISKGAEVEKGSHSAKAVGKGRAPVPGNNGSCKWDLSKLPAEAAELVGQVGHMSKTQAGSKYLQRQLLRGQGATVDVILSEVEDEIAALMCDAYGNYLCSAAFTACSQRQRKRMLEKLAPEVAVIACDKRGTHALQALIGLLQLEEEQHQLMSSIKEHVIALCMDPNGTHVVQRLLSSFVPPVADWIYVAVNDRMIEVAHHPYGLCVLKKCISQAKQAGRHREMLLRELARHAMDLVQSPYGNYAIQHALEEWGGQCCQPILHKLEGRMMQLSIQKFSSNVVEKLFCSAPADFRNRFIAELVESEKMSVLVNSNYGHYVAKRALQLATPEQSQALLEAIRSNLASLPNRRLRVKWEKVMTGKGDDDDEDDRQMMQPEVSPGGKGFAPGRSGKGAGGKSRGGRARGVGGYGAHGFSEQ
eukprot:TRINITY_DN22489_c0_g1_i1.p1 TRINITY_DN22489_c0_g1~~TRINITY_DN22489_c0_g1_i1.p1  ORF type:complete len:983 (+),score=209.48 TRINITY_DN22489_c0_g1_i1:122-3070(+)